MKLFGSQPSAYLEAERNAWLEYREWAEKQECHVCGKKRSDVPRDENGVAMEWWVTETLCGDHRNE